MLEPEEFDDDFFTPLSNTPLSNIFHASSKKDSVNDSLKYTPPKKPAQKVDETKANEDTKAPLTECLLACALTAYEWIDNNYLPRGLLGFAIIKTQKNNQHNIILYNANKTTISSTIVSPKLQMTLKSNNYLSYYDNSSKYWSLYAGKEEIKKITETLVNLGIEINHSASTDEKPPEPEPSSMHYEEDHTATNISDKESDTDSSVLKKTKASILSRMASMGQSVLPTTNMQSDDKLSDSSDTSELLDKPRIIKHKPKVFAKRNLDKNKISACEPIDSHLTTVATIEPHTSSSTMYTFINGQLVPFTNTNIANYGPSSSNDMSLLLSEQRIQNNEIRININRNTDKLDQVLEKVKNLDICEIKGNNSFQTEIMQKLISEYESKIKMYEEILVSNKINLVGVPTSSNLCKEMKDYEIKITELQKEIREKDTEIVKLKELQKVNLKTDDNDSDLLNQIADLKQCLLLKTEELGNFEIIARSKDDDAKKEFGNKLKALMNEAFQTISTNFENDDYYSGEHIKSVVATVIKKVTVQSLNECM